MNLVWSAYRVAAPCVGAILPALARALPRSRRPAWKERLGHVAAVREPDAWIHAASLGEATAVGPLVRELATARPEARFLLTAMTAGGRDRLAGMGRATALAPVDTPQAVQRFLAGVVPSRLIVVETELWPQWLLCARARQVPVAVVSGRLSGRSLTGYRRLGGAFRALVAGLAGVACQTEEDLERWRLLGARAEVSAVGGNLKDDALPDGAADRGQARARLGLAPTRPLLVLGSLRPGEGRVLARAWLRLPAGVRERWQVVAVPRHPRACSGLRAEAAGAGVAEAGGGGVAWAWDDRLGVLGGYYAAADVAFVGGSVGRYGGHNPLEPAACGAAVLMGPHHAAQRGAVEALRRAGALRVAGGEGELVEALERLLGDEGARAEAQRAGLAVVARRRGAARRTVGCLQEWGLWPAA